MIFTIEHVDEIKKRLIYLEEHFNIDISDDLEKLEEEKIEDIDEIEIGFPDEYDRIEYSIEDFWKYTADLEKIESIGDSTVRNSSIRQTILDVDEFDYEKYNINQYGLETSDYVIRIISNPILIGLFASREGLCDDNYGITPCSMYFAVEIEYLNSNKLILEDENKIINRFLFFVSSRINISVRIGEFFTMPDDYYEEYDKGVKNQSIININDIPEYTLAMQYYVDALSISNNEIKYLYFYKIIEYFSPLVSKKKSYELLNQKLDTMYVKNKDHKYLESIFQLTRSHDISVRDKELANTVLCECIDISELFEYLPMTIKNRLVKKIKFKIEDLNKLKSDKILDIKKELGTYLYSTRNSIVHAKSNYELKGNECLESDLDDINVFMSKICYCLIVWNGRQAHEFQI